MKKNKKEYLLKENINEHITTFLNNNFSLFNNLSDYLKIFTYFSAIDNLSGLFINPVLHFKYYFDFSFGTEPKITKITDNDLIVLSLENYNQVLEYQYIRIFYSKIQSRLFVLKLKNDFTYDKTKKLIRGRNGFQFIEDFRLKLTNQLKDLFLEYYTPILRIVSILNNEKKLLWYNLFRNIDNFDVVVFCEFVDKNPYYFINAPIGYRDKVKSIYKKYLFSFEIINDISTLTSDEKGNLYISDDYYNKIREIFPSYFIEFFLEPPQDDFISDIDMSNRYNDEKIILDNFLIEVEKDEYEDEPHHTYYYFIENKDKILNVLNLVLERYESVKNNPIFNSALYSDLYNYILKNINMLNSNDINITRLYKIFSNPLFYNRQTGVSFYGQVLSISPLHYITKISPTHIYENEFLPNRRGTLSYQVNGNLSVKEFFQKIWNNLYNLISEVLYDKYYNDDIFLINDVKIIITIYKYNKVNGIRYSYNITVLFTTLEETIERLKIEFIKFLFDFEYLISFYTSELLELASTFELGINTQDFEVSYLLEKKASGFDYLFEKQFITKISKNECPFNKDGYFYCPSNKDKLCFCYCLNIHGYKDCQGDLQHIGINYIEYGVSINDVINYCNFKKIYILMYDEETNSFIACGEENDKPIYICRMSLQNGNYHYIYFSTKEIKNKKLNKKSKNMENKFIYFDVETITTSYKRILKCISNFWIELTEEQFENFDFDNIDYSNHSHFDYNINYVFNEGSNCLLPMINYCIKNSRKYRIFLIGYNISGFDMFFVMDCLRTTLYSNFEIRAKSSVFYVKNRIYQLRYHNLQSFDLYLHLRMSLYDACIAFKTNPVKEKDLGKEIITLLQKTYDENPKMLRIVFNNNKNKLKDYNGKDVYSLISLTKNYQYLISTLEPFKDFKIWYYMTLPSMINNYFQRYVYPKQITKEKQGYNIVKPYTRDDYITFKSPMWQCAGIVGIFGNCSYSKIEYNCQLVDIASQYPYCCMSNMFPCNDYRIEKFDDFLQPDLSKLGIYWCEINTYGLFLPPQGKKNKNNTNNWQSQKNKSYWRALTTPEIIWIKSHKVYINDEEKNLFVKAEWGYTFDGQNNPFVEFMSPIAERKMRRDLVKYKKEHNLELTEEDKTFDNSVLRTLEKLILNATTGAVNQKLHETQTLIKDTGFLEVINLKINADIDKLEKSYLKRNVSRPYLGTYIYAYARLMICDIVYEIEHNKPKTMDYNLVIYGDTDSLLIKDEGIDIWENNPKINWRLRGNDINKIGKFGYFVNEGHFEKNYLIDKKIYAFTNENLCYPICQCSLDTVKKGECKNGNKYRLKGIGIGINLDENGYYIIPIKRDKHIVSKDLKKELDKKCDEQTKKVVKELLGIEYILKEENKDKVLRTYELNYYPEMRKIEAEYFEIKNKIINMRNILIYEYLLEDIQLKVIRENHLERDKKDYSIKQIVKEMIVSPNTAKYNELKLTFQIRKLYKKGGKILKKQSQIKSISLICNTL